MYCKYWTWFQWRVQVLISIVRSVLVLQVLALIPMEALGTLFYFKYWSWFQGMVQVLFCTVKFVLVLQVLVSDPVEGSGTLFYSEGCISRCKYWSWF